MVETQEAKSPEIKPKKKNIFGGASGGKSEHNKVIADKVTLNIMRNPSTEDDNLTRASSGLRTSVDGLSRTTMGGTAIERGTEKLRALGHDDTEG